MPGLHLFPFSFSVMLHFCVMIFSAVLFASAQSRHVHPAWFFNTQSEWHLPFSQSNRALLSEVAGAKTAHCGPLTRKLVQGVARENTVLVTVVDKIIWKCFGPSYVENIQAANISYWLIAALDPETSMALASMGVKQCFNAPQDRLKYKGSDTKYQWGGHHWSMTTWNKVHIMKSVYEMGVHVVHSDMDVVWFNDPLPYFKSLLEKPVHIVIATDAVTSENPKGDTGLEALTSPHANINTGIYFMRQWPGGLEFFNIWLSWQDKRIGHDQDGFNFVSRGYYFHGDADMPLATQTQDRMFYCAYSNTTAVSFLPASMFGNTYTYVNARLWEKLDHPLYEVHWVWGGSTMESKRQNMRDAMKFHDEPEYYTSPYLITFALEQLKMPEGFNSWEVPRTEEMIRFHVTAANHQLQQAYYAFAAALITNRTLVMPRFLCYCSKNWYQTQSCRINDEKLATFPFVCALSHVLRVKKLQQGFELPANTDYSGHKVFIREYSFLENPKVPDEIKRSYLEVVPSAVPRPPGQLTADQLVLSTDDTSSRGYGRRITVAAPLSDWEFHKVLERYGDVRVVHLPQPSRTLSGFSKPETAKQFDVEIQRRVTYWCCRSPPVMATKNLTEGVQLVGLPQNRWENLPLLGKRYSYLHQTPPLSGTNVGASVGMGLPLLGEPKRCTVERQADVKLTIGAIMQNSTLRAKSFSGGPAVAGRAARQTSAVARPRLQTWSAVSPNAVAAACTVTGAIPPPRRSTTSSRAPAFSAAQPPRHPGRRSSVKVHANWGAPVEFKPAKIVSNTSAAAGPLHKLVIDVGPLAAGYAVPGQFIQIKVGDSKPGFFAIASAPGAHSDGLLEFLIKGAPGTTAELLCNAGDGTEVAVSPVMGKGFPLDRLPASNTTAVLMFATGSGISPIRAVIDSGTLAGRDITLYYGTRNTDSTAYRELLPDWQAKGVKVVQVFSESKQGYVHDVFEREGLSKLPADAASAVGALLCGHKGMCQAITSLLTAKGVPPEKILLNF
ncbi:hypothetical protein VOLCADRAFT_106094 [Volvox carteri f. nagariensis]|uniref:FAD-binding FR-type domain-containing protein n=1 Tax=Volvox carteri f. nagariensis TaxID=3068 RepID=D8U515_VOLCA|nr:uncharacterized protein VOLCADRAFT_106094 [Volvox carteri f. nagariensis]EFJ45138.1 hypothetical protein VOLCADRAFT_106094 [Volvox carteri f. nagariensis]|eukprot:XP_002953814.1 hypothetical protein VOLCADRAFT_106094 [Volvox carteri f. nagariensis]